MRRTLTIAAAASISLAAVLVSAPSASASQDTACMRAGIAALKSVGAHQAVAKAGLPIATAVALGVTPRAGTDVSALPDPLPYSLVLADHRAGSNSLFIYPWCG